MKVTSRRSPDHVDSPLERLAEGGHLSEVDSPRTDDGP